VKTETRRARDRWRRLINRAIRAYRYNVPAAERVGHREHVRREVAAGNREARRWVLAWSGDG
jgi:hypothetical protein